MRQRVPPGPPVVQALTTAAGFNFDLLRGADRETVVAATAEIKTLQRRVAGDVIAIGEHLIAVKRTLPHGMFQIWLGAEFKWSERTARNYMRLASNFGDKTAIVADLPLAILYRLASVPLDHRATKFIDRAAAAGRKITEDEAVLLIGEVPDATPVRRETVVQIGDATPVRDRRDKRQKKFLEKFAWLNVCTFIDEISIVRLHPDAEGAFLADLDRAIRDLQAFRVKVRNAYDGGER